VDCQFKSLDTTSHSLTGEYANDEKGCDERAKALVKMVKTAPKPNYLVADCKLYHKDNAEFLSQLTFITLISSTIKLEKRSLVRP